MSKLENLPGSYDDERAHRLEHRPDDVVVGWAIVLLLMLITAAGFGEGCFRCGMESIAQEETAGKTQNAGQSSPAVIPLAEQLGLVPKLEK